MNWPTWLPALTSSGILALLTLIGGYFLKAGIERGIGHGLDRELEKLKARLRAEEEQTKALRSGALAALTSRHEALDQRRLKACEALWAATISQARFRMALGFVAAMKVEAVLEASARQDQEGAGLRRLGEALWQAASLDKLINEQPAIPDTERLFVPPMAWAAFKAYRAIYAHAVVILTTMKLGVGADFLKGTGETIKLVSGVLPHQKETLAKYGDALLFHLTEELEEKIFTELTLSLSGLAADREIIDQSFRLLRYAGDNHAGQIAEGLPEKYRAEPVVTK